MRIELCAAKSLRHFISAAQKGCQGDPPEQRYVQFPSRIDVLKSKVGP